ncbi:hypothetical protein ESCO_000383 [Escovopsis weberi]|uniref:Uncharacterized protein n=1 Tax=Escovopsis weberi TaxID=150374 RepID=A0A0M8MSS4_ESCWE|nr:hypothetical protein ESCO_000383 [Escovopsis weberi]
MSLLTSCRKALGRKIFQFEVTFAVYMFTPYEKFAFYSITFLLLSLTFIAATLYLPHHVSILAGRVWYYINGENIDVAASAREVVKEISEGVFGVASTTTGLSPPALEAALEAAKTMVKEL